VFRFRSGIVVSDDFDMAEKTTVFALFTIYDKESEIKLLVQPSTCVVSKRSYVKCVKPIHNGTPCPSSRLVCIVPNISRIRGFGIFCSVFGIVTGDPVLPLSDAPLFAD
jgi:hypothetical protein